MNDSQLFGLRDMFSAMQTEATDWQWIGKHLSQRMFGITKSRAQAYAARHGGVAKPMDAFAHYWAGSVSESVLNDYRSGRAVVVKAR